MKKIFLSLIPLLLLLYFNPLNASPFPDPGEEKELTPEGFNYQAIARGVSGKPIAEKEISVRISMLNGEEGGFIEYTETHRVKRTDLVSSVSLLAEDKRKKAAF